MNTERSFQEAERAQRGSVRKDRMGSEKYPLWCVDTDHPVGEMRFFGPFTTREDAQSHIDNRTPEDVEFYDPDAYPWTVVRCRCATVEEIGAGGALEALLWQIDSKADGHLPGYAFGGSMVGKKNTRVPDMAAAREALVAWAKTHLRVDVFICETDDTGEGEVPK